MKKNSIHHGDFLESPIIASSVDLIVTSPPYYNARMYAQWPSYGAYLGDVMKWLVRAFEVIKPGRRVCWNVGIIPGGADGYYAIPHDTVHIAQAVGFIFRDDIIWSKKNSHHRAPPGSFPYPPGIIITNAHEHVLCFQKPGNSQSDVRAEWLEDSKLTKAEYSRFICHSVWSFPQAPLTAVADITDENVPAPFPIELATQLIRLFSVKGELVLDPFMGAGTTALAARREKRFWIGCEIHERSIETALTRIQNNED